MLIQVEVKDSNKQFPQSSCSIVIRQGAFEMVSKIENVS